MNNLVLISPVLLYRLYTVHDFVGLYIQSELECCKPVVINATAQCDFIAHTTNCP